MASFSSNMSPIKPLYSDWPTFPVHNNTSVTLASKRMSTPDLTTSPASSTSSISSTFDESWPTTPDLNPQAQPFVPGSLLMHNPSLFKDQLDAQLLSSIPFDYLEDAVDGLPDFKLAPLSDWDTFSEEPLEIIENSSTPPYPPGLRFPPTCLLNHLPPPTVPPSYLPLIANCLRPGTQDHDIEAYSRVIISSRPRWDLESLLELCERICFEMHNPCTKPADEDGGVIKACDSARYIGVHPTPLISYRFFVEYERGAQRQHAITIMVKHLNQHLSAIQSEEVAQLFMWNLRELVLTRFRETWDIDNLKGRAMSLSQPATSYDVRCALILCKSIASFFSQKLIHHQHITMCMNILLRHLMSIEHVEALALFTLGCGPAFWDLSTFTSHTTSHQKYTAGLVQTFLATLFTSVANFKLDDSKSLVFPPQAWGEGQLMTRIHQIEVAVEKWAVLLSRSPINTQDPTLGNFMTVF